MVKNIHLLAIAALLLSAPAIQLFSVNPVKDQPVTVIKDVKSDAEVTKAVKDAISKDFAKFSGNVTTDKGVVTLTGTVDTMKTKMDIEAKAKSVAGVDKVVNSLEVKPEVKSF